jgi:hypothetical protein
MIHRNALLRAAVVVLRAMKIVTVPVVNIKIRVALLALLVVPVNIVFVVATVVLHKIRDVLFVLLVVPVSIANACAYRVLITRGVAAV